MDAKMLLWHSQIHGVKRLIEPRHRLYWAIALMVLVPAALSNLMSTIVRFFEMPTHLVTLDTVKTKILFPSVLVCPEIYFPSYKIDKFLENATYPPGITANTIRPIIKQLGAYWSPDAPYSVDDLSRVLEFLDHNDLDVEEAGQLLTSSCGESLLRCRFLRDDYNCLDIFHMEFTTYGICCVFNGRSLKRDIKLGGDRRKKLRLWYSSEVGPFAALMVAVNQSQHMDNVDLTYKWMVIQKARRYIDGTNNGTALSPGTEMWSSFHSKYLEVTEESRFLGDKLRGCQFDTRKLNFYKTYNKSHCLLECNMNNLLKRCHCLLPHHYRPPDVPICDAQGLTCAKTAIGQFNEADCDCPLSCYYQIKLLETETYQISAKAQTVDSFYNGLNLSSVTVVRVFLKSRQTTSFYRRPLYNSYDLFSQLGGVFNVFFGCSIISILELLQLAWYSVRYPKPPARQAPNSMKRKKQKIHSFFFGVCCRARRGGQVGKRGANKRVTFLERCHRVKQSTVVNYRL